MSSTTTHLVNEAGQQHALEVTEAIREELLRIVDTGEHGAVIGSAPAGGGKTYFVIETLQVLISKGLSVMVCTPTNKQVHELIERALDAGIELTFLHGRDKEIEERDGLTQTSSASELQESLPQVAVSTVAKAGSAAMSEAGLGPFDVLILDEAYQVQSAAYMCIGDVSKAHLLVGDPGQLDPFTQLGAVDWWTALKEDPLSTAVSVIKRYHPQTKDFKFPLTRRLDERGARIAQPFYGNDHHFSAWIPEGVRTLTLGCTPEDSLDVTLDMAASRGYGYLRLPEDQTASQAKGIASAMAEAASRLIERGAVVEDERGSGPLAPERILMGVSTNEQRVLVEEAMRGYPSLDGVSVLTANKAQGLEFDVTIVWHPLAGLQSVSPFVLDTGRLCVLLTRHRHCAVIVGREGDEGLVQGAPIETGAYPGEADKTLQGWYSHQGLFGILLEGVQ